MALATIAATASETRLSMRIASLSESPSGGVKLAGGVLTWVVGFS